VLSIFGETIRTSGLFRIAETMDESRGIKLIMVLLMLGSGRLRSNMEGLDSNVKEVFVVRPYPVVKEVKDTKLKTNTITEVKVRKKRSLRFFKFVLVNEKNETLVSPSMYGMIKTTQRTIPIESKIYHKSEVVEINLQPGYTR
jgi:hypothetical protein